MYILPLRPYTKLNRYATNRRAYAFHNWGSTFNSQHYRSVSIFQSETNDIPQALAALLFTALKIDERLSKSSKRFRRSNTIDSDFDMVGAITS